MDIINLNSSLAFAKFYGNPFTNVVITKQNVKPDSYFGTEEYFSISAELEMAFRIKIYVFKLIFPLKLSFLVYFHKTELYFYASIMNAPFTSRNGFM